MMAPSKPNSLVSISALCILIGAVLLLQQTVSAMQLVEQVEPNSRSGPQTASATLAVVESPELVVRVLESLLRSILYSASADIQVGQSNGAQKRGLDLGISRGFSGSQAGKHLMGLSAASFANGPGKR